jgi:hypothetical protein
MTPSRTTPPADSNRLGSGALKRFIGAPFRTDTYANLLYLLCAFPLGVAYLVLVVTGFSIGIATSPLLVGIPILVAVIAGTAVLGALEAQLTSRLLGIETALPETLREENPDGIRRIENGPIDTLLDLFTAPTTWTTLVLLLLKFVYGIVVFTILVSAAALTVGFVSAPLVYDHPDVSYTIGVYAIETLSEAFGLAVVGVLVGFVSIHLLNGLATAGGFLTATLLDLDRSSESSE